MKTYFMVMMMFTLLTSSNYQDNYSKDESDKETVKEFIQALATGDTLKIGSFLLADGKFFGPRLDDSVGREHVINFWTAGWRKRWASVNYSRKAITSFAGEKGGKLDGDWISDWGIWTFESKENKPRISFWQNWLFKVKYGKISASRLIFNENDIFTQRGYSVSPPVSSEPKK